MDHDVHVLATGDEAAAAAAEHLVARAREASADARRASWALSGGGTPTKMFEVLARLDVPFECVAVFQVDERLAPDGDPARNATHLLEALGRDLVHFHPMEVTDPDAVAAAGRYASALPARFDLVHLGLGPDGHTASLVPGDPVLEVRDVPVALTGEYEGHRRMTLTYPVLDSARELVWLVAGEEKRDALAKLLAGDPSIPAGRVAAERSIVFCDRAAR